MQATSNPALSTMQDIHTPEVIGQWPLAYGYWVALALILLLTAMTIWKYRQRHRLHAAKREVLRQLDALAMASDTFSLQVNTLIKRAAISYLPREQVASMQGDNWAQWMNAQVTQPTPELHTLLDRRYQRQALTSDEAASLKNLALLWLKEALPLERQIKHKNKDITC